MIKTVRNEQTNQSLNTRIETEIVVKYLQKDLFRLQGELTIKSIRNGSKNDQTRI